MLGLGKAITSAHSAEKLLFQVSTITGRRASGAVEYGLPTEYNLDNRLFSVFAVFLNHCIH